MANEKPKFIETKPSEDESLYSGGTAGVLPAERKKATFEVMKMTNVLDGGPEKTKRRRFILSPTKGLDVSAKYYYNRHEYMREHVHHFIEMHKDFWGNFIPTREDVAWMSENSMLGGALMNHYGLFLLTLVSQCDAEQKAMWLIPAFQMQIIGCYAQTELGHGSNVRGLMTTATYDKNTQEFILNTPTLRSIKWWPGALGKVGTHAIVYAQLIIDGKEYGVHPFMLQIRDENHKPFTGIQLGDVGPKFGDHGNDTGYMILDNVRIPREYLLAAHQRVTPEGQYVKSEKKQQNEKLTYATMMITRGFMVKTSAGFLSRAVTIAMRYSAVRTQGFVNAKKVTSYKSTERQILDYQVQRYRIFKQMAIAYAIKFTGRWMLESFSQLDGEDKASISFQNIDALPFLAATSMGLKAICTYIASSGIEDCRKCCGGNGYLLVSGLATLAADYLWQTTAEGDFIVMMLQTASFLMKTVDATIKGKTTVTGPVDYLAPLLHDRNLRVVNVPKANSAEDFMNLEFLIKIFQAGALQNVLSTHHHYKGDLEKKSQDEAWNSNSIEMLNAVRAHCYYFILQNFVGAVNKVEDSACQNVLRRVCALYACSNMMDEPHWIGILTLDQVRMVKSATMKLLDLLRPEGVALVDAFDIPDNVLNSAIGKYDGNVYEALYESVKRNPLNQTEVFEGYEKVLRPYLDLELLKNGNMKPKL